MIIEKIEERIVKTKVLEIRCDHCGKLLGEVEQTKYLDYIPEIGDIELNIHMPNGWYRYKATLCEGCKKTHLKQMEKLLEKIGFLKQGNI